MKRSLWALVIVVPLVALLATGFRHDPNAIASPLLGKRAPTFSLATFNGGHLSLQQYRGKPVVVNFWASWCVDCKVEHPALLQAYQNFARRGVAFVGVDYEDAITDARGYLRKQGGAWPNLTDPGQRTAISYGVYGVPETFLIDRHGIIRYKFTGPVSPATFEQDLNQLVQEPA